MPEALDRLIALAGTERVGSYTRKTKSGKTVHVDAYTRDPGTMSNGDLFKAFKDLKGKPDAQSRNQHARVVTEIKKRQAAGEWGHSDKGASTRAQNRVDKDKGAGDRGRVEARTRFEENRNNPKPKFERLVKYETGAKDKDGKPVREPVRDKDGKTVNTPAYNEHVAKLTKTIDDIYADPKKLAKYDTQKKHGLWTKVKDPETGEMKPAFVAYTPERTEQHRKIINDILEKHKDVPAENKAIMSGGLGGAGKGYVLGKFAGIDESQYIVIDPDQMKGEILSRGMGPDVPDLLPMEQATFIHEESSDLANMLQEIALSRGLNIILDTTMAAKKDTDDESSADKKIKLFSDAGYDIRGVFVDVPVEVSVDSALDRHAGGVDKFNSGKEGGEMGGRYVPPSYIMGAAPSEGQKSLGYNSKNRAVFERLKKEGKFSSAEVWDNSDRTKDPQLVERGAPTPPKSTKGTGNSSIDKLKSQVAPSKSTAPENTTSSALDKLKNKKTKTPPKVALSRLRNMLD